jgi:ketosteroid isomerase-like protein
MPDKEITTMHRRLTLGLVLAVAVGLGACGGSAPSQAFAPSDAEQIKGMLRDFVAAYNAKDVAKIGTFFSINAALMPANRSILRGIDAVKGYYEGRVKDEGATGLAIEPMTVEGHGPLAYVAGTFTLTLQPPDGSPARHDRGKVIWIVRKFGEQWKFEWQIMSSDLPPVIPPAH